MTKLEEILYTATPADPLHHCLQILNFVTESLTRAAQVAISLQTNTKV